MARRFQASQLISFPAPAALVGVDGGPLTIIACFKVNTSAYQALLYTKTSGGTGAWWVEVDPTGGLHANYGTGTTARPVGTVATGAYMVGVWRKDSGGTFQPVGRYLTGAGFTTDSGDITAVSTLVDGSALDSGALAVLGKWGASDFSSDLEVAGVAVLNSYLAGGSIPALTTWAAILALNPTWWVSCEGSTVTDKAGGTPTITGATVVTDPSGFFSSSVSAVLAAPLGGLAAAMAAAGSSPAVLAAPLGGLAAAMAAAGSSPAVLAAPLGGLAAAMAAAGSSPAVLAAPLGGLAAAMAAAGSSPAVLAAPLGGLAAAMTAMPSTPDPGHVAATFAAVLGGLAAAMAAAPRDPTTTGVRAVIRPGPVPVPALRPGPAAAAALRPA